MRTLAAHEAIPGHHFQIASQVEMTTLPSFRRQNPFGSMSAYTEGWGLYAERLAADLGWYKNDPVSDLGRLNGELFRARRLVVDTGIHRLGWTRQQAIDYLREHAPEEPVSEIDRYISWPGQALAYKMGQLKIRQLRAGAEQRLGAKFDVRDFHDAVLRNGTLPLDLLQAEVERYAAAR